MTSQQTPTTVDELVAVVRTHLADQKPFVTEGQATKRHFGPAVQDSVTRIALRALDRITAYEPGDLVVSVQAGVRLTELQKQLAQHGQWLPIDPPHAAATMGGILASASAGPRRLGYGTVKDHLLGMSILGATGEVTRSGGRVVKNVSGYDLHKLQVGGFGTLGVIVEAHLKVVPLPAVSGAVLFGFDTHDQAHRRLLQIWAAPALRPVALEAWSGLALTAVKAALPTSLTSAKAVAVVGVQGSRSVFDRHVRELGSEGVMVEGPEAERIWDAARDLDTTQTIVVRIGARPQELPALLAALDLSRVGGISTHVGTGIARLHVAAAGDAAMTAHTIADWQKQAAALGAYAVTESAALNLQNRESLFRRNERSGLGTRLLDTFNPAGLMNPGRMVSL